MTNTMYIGPSVRGVVKHGAAFSGGASGQVGKAGGRKTDYQKFNCSRFGTGGRNQAFQRRRIRRCGRV